MLIFKKNSDLTSNQIIAKQRRIILYTIIILILLIIFNIYNIIPQIKIETEIETYENPKIVGKLLEPEVLKEVEIPKETKIDLGEFRLTAYCPCKICCGKWSPEVTGKESRTASGTIPQANRTVAADINILPFGSIIEIGGVRYTVEDTGSGVNGKHIDIYYDSHSEALNSGLYKGNVYLIKENY